ncbi:MAG: MBL fold metallo-hydrolase [Syntrophaceae bacterium]
MIFQRIESEGLAHYSYMIGDRQEAIVIDPRRDCDPYIDIAEKEGFRITNILETHRNEDYLIGSIELASRTGAEIWHAEPELGYRYGKTVEDGREWKAGRLKIKAIHTPGHTSGHMSYLLHDSKGNPWVLFSGDTLFAGDVGRTDLAGKERIPEMTGLLYDSIFSKIIPLGDHVVVCPAHGSGSVCAASIADRVWTSIGMERLYNPKLRHTQREDFIKNNGQELEVPPYFRKMEELNLFPPLLSNLPVPTPLSADKFMEQSSRGTVLDSRLELDFGAAHVPGSLSIWMGGIPSFAGWFIDYDRPVFLVGETEKTAEVVRMLARMGYDRIGGSLSGGMLAWHMAGEESASNGMEPVQSLCGRIDGGEDFFILDVRSEDELRKEGRIPTALNIHITQLPGNLDKIPRDRPVHIFCGSGLRSTIAASLLQRAGWKDITVILGGMAGWKSQKCPVEK